MSAATNDDRVGRADPSLPGIRARLNASNGVTYYFRRLIADVGGVATKVTGTSGLKIRGWCDNREFTADTSAAADTNLKYVDVLAGQIELDVSGSAPPTVADHLKMMYAEDDHTVNRTSAGGTLSPVGRLLSLRTVGGVTKALCEVGLFGTEQVDMAADYLLIADAAATTPGLGADLIGAPDPGGFTSETTTGGQLQEIYQDLKSAQGHIDLMPCDFTLLTGAPLALFSAGASSVPGLALANSEAQAIRWNDNATLDGILSSFGVPPDLDTTANGTVTMYASKIGATLGDAVTFAVGLYNQVVGATHDADTDFGGTSGAMTGNAASKTVQAVTRTITAADWAASPAGVTLTLKPTDGTLGTDDLCLHRVRITYKKKPLTS
jgi:hypothetical protein